jgi:NAD(P)-dependent dehydrogenase (short-subunit alcohol dehydrogenase family)
MPPRPEREETMGALEGKVAFITGRSLDRLDDAVAALGDNVGAVRGDVADLGDLDRLYATISARAGHLDVIVANAALRVMVPFAEVTVADFDATYGVNVRTVAADGPSRRTRRCHLVSSQRREQLRHRNRTARRRRTHRRLTDALSALHTCRRLVGRPASVVPQATRPTWLANFALKPKGSTSAAFHRGFPCLAGTGPRRRARLPTPRWSG